MKRVWLIVFGDFVAFWITFVLLIIIRFKSQDYTLAFNVHILPFFLLYLSWILIFYVFGLYDLVNIKPTIPYLKRWVIATLCSFAIGILLFYFVPIFGISPKINLVIQVLGFASFSFLFRRIIYTLFSKKITRPTILIGDSIPLTSLENTILNNPQIGLEIAGHYENIDNLSLEKENKKNILIILDKDIEVQDVNIVDFLKKGIEITDTAEAYEKYLYRVPVEYINLSFIIENIQIKKDIFYKILTFFLEKSFTIITLLITSPFLIIISMIIYLEDKGPIFYTHHRVGLNGKIFKLYKLRSMRVDAEKDGVKWSSGKDDPRITKIGKIIRKIHIDEAPQMINIIKGDIALVGPRPERPEFVELLDKEIPYYSFRHLIRPGFTGWAQIKYKYTNTTEGSKEKFEYDLFYIKNRNIFIDIGIILRTIQIIFTH